jgi:5-methylcytosine-specific restriction endonuclease McrA
MNAVAQQQRSPGLRFALREQLRCRDLRREIRTILTGAQAGRCYDCRRVRELTIGHLVPLDQGGSNVRANLVGQCANCNERQDNQIHPSITDARPLLAGLVPDPFWRSPAAPVTRPTAVTTIAWDSAS